MVRVKRGTTSLKHRKSLLSRTKGYRFGRSTKEREARDAMYHAGNYAFAHRRKKKGDFRRLWSIRINAAIRPLGLSYSKFVHMLAQKGSLLNRKMLQEIAQANPDTFKRIVEMATK